jgi:hypothetical protein
MTTILNHIVVIFAEEQTKEHLGWLKERPDFILFRLFDLNANYGQTDQT